MSELSKRMRDGDIDAIIEGMMSDAGIYRAQAIVGAVNNKVIDSVIEEQLYKLKNDDLVVIGYSISDFAVAALDKFGIEKYIGNDPGILLLIENDKWWD